MSVQYSVASDAAAATSFRSSSGDKAKGGDESPSFAEAWYSMGELLASYGIR
jgi:hypothetical protein